VNRQSGREHSEADRHAREQIEALLNETLFVEAGAGTGKTAALVQRYLSLVLGGRTVDRIVAITFTDKAAAELRDRVRQGLESRLAGECTPEQKDLIDDALANLDRAQISTIHAFCQRLLRSFAVRSGIDPAFEVDDEVAALRRFEERWRAFLDGLGSEREAVTVIGRVLDLGLATRDLQTLARDLWRRGELAERLRAEPLTAPEAGSLDLEAMLDEIRSIDVSRVPLDDYLRPKVIQVREMLEDLTAARAEERIARLVALMSNRPKLGSGQQGNWGGRDGITAVRSSCNSVLDMLQEHIDSLRAVALADALPLVVRFVAEEMQRRAQEGRLIFDDLILRVRDVLASDRDARIDVRHRYDTILIDEFQDTDPLQADIALCFARPAEGGEPEPGRLFFVGDPKQSIYRFRRADMAVYAATSQTLAAAGARTIDLSLNRRSVPGVLEWVNHVFERLFIQGLPPVEVQPPYKPIGAHREAGLHGAAVSWLGGEIDMKAGQVRLLEARHIAAHCRDVVSRGWEVGLRDGSKRRAAYRDIAILLPARTSLQPLERALAAENIPYRVEGGSLVYATQEVRDIINCLTAIDDPGDDVAVVAALRSPAYACSDVEITRYRRGGGSFNYLWPGLESEVGRVAEALRDLRDWHEQRALGPLAGLVERFIEARRLVEIGLVDSGNRNAFRRARFLVEQARAFEAPGPESLRAFVEWLEARAGDAILDYEGAGLDDDEDAVRVLTIHAAKGLEFPIVFLAGLGTPPRLDTPTFGHDRDSGRIAVRIGSSTRNAVFTLGPVEDVQQHEQQHATAERDRLLYVAATRARDHLVVSLFRKVGTNDCAAARLEKVGARDFAEPMPAVELSARTSGTPFSSLDIDEPDTDEASFETQRAALVTSARTQRYTSATALGRAQGQDEERDPEDESEPWARGRAGTHLGRAVHAALQTLPWDADDETIEAVARAQSVAEAIPHRETDAARLIRAALATGAATRARSARRALREVPFALPDGDLVLEGYVDLLIENGDGIEIVDWKTDQVAPAAVPQRLREYELQAGVYVLGIEAATRRSVTRVTYVFISAGREESPGEPAALAEAARHALAAKRRPLRSPRRARFSVRSDRSR
jgi:ATP-dependent helicase/nuclease subunit A